MADIVEVKPTPIQRNSLDVAVELFQEYAKYNDVSKVEDIQEVFLKLYSTVEGARFIGTKNLIDYMPNELQDVFKKNYR
jgi:hypothetical protein